LINYKTEWCNPKAADYTSSLASFVRNNRALRIVFGFL